MKFGETSLTSLLLLHSSLFTTWPPSSSESRGEKAFTEDLGASGGLSVLSEPCMAVLQRVKGIWGQSEPDKDAIIRGMEKGSVSWGSSESLSMIWLKVGRVYSGGQSDTPKEEAFESLP